jgi:hypothetical protein
MISLYWPRFVRLFGHHCPSVTMGTNEKEPVCNAVGYRFGGSSAGRRDQASEEGEVGEGL